MHILMVILITRLFAALIPSVLDPKNMLNKNYFDWM